MMFGVLFNKKNTRQDSALSHLVTSILVKSIFFLKNKLSCFVPFHYVKATTWLNRYTSNIWICFRRLYIRIFFFYLDGLCVYFSFTWMGRYILKLVKVIQSALTFWKIQKQMQHLSWCVDNCASPRYKFDSKQLQSLLLIWSP